MKKTLLLGVAASMLSFSAMNVNAASNDADLTIHAWFVKPFNLVKEQYLGFGMILADGGGKTVVVTPNGELDKSKSTATMMSAAKFKNFGEKMWAYGSLNEGLLRAEGALSGVLGPAVFNNLDESILNSIVSVNFSDDTVDLTSDDQTCGTVKDFTTHLTVEGDDILVHVGGTLETADLTGINGAIDCYGLVTLTFIMNEENLTAIQNHNVDNGIN